MDTTQLETAAPPVVVVPDMEPTGDVDVPDEDVSGEDIDPSDWLAAAAADGFEPQYVSLDNGKRIKMAALTDSEELRVREMSKRRDKQTGAVRLNNNLYKRNFIATAINKAYGRSMGDPKFILGDHLAQRPTGELNELLKAAFRISGMKLDQPAQSVASELFD